MVDIELEPLGLAPDKAPGEDEAELRTFLGKRNIVRLGAPRSEEVRRPAKEGFAFLRIRPSMTLLPDRHCAFVAAELSVELSAASADGAPVARPIAYDVQPAEIVEELTYTTRSGSTYEVGGEASAGFGKLLAKITQENSSERGGVRVIRRMYGYGVNFSEVGWRMRATADHELAGDVLGLEFVAQVPAGAVLTGRFYIAADVAVSTAADRWLTAGFGPRDRGPVLEVSYTL